MNGTISSVVARLAWQASRKLQPFCARTAVILEYHSIPTVGYDGEININVFEKHILFLKQHYEIVPGPMLFERRKPFDKVRVMLTFDDGFRNHAEHVAPLLRKYNLPATFFVPSRHCLPGKYLWFSYLLALERYYVGNGFLFRAKFIDMSNSQRRFSVQKLRRLLLSLRPHPAAMYDAIEQELPVLEDFANRQELNDKFAGMTCEQLAELGADALFTIGAHTVDHPLLTECPEQEAAKQIANNKLWIEKITQKSCDAIAYPGGCYQEAVLELCRNLGFAYGYAETPRLSVARQYEIPRFGIYSQSVDVLGAKVAWGPFIRACLLEIG